MAAPKLFKIERTGTALVVMPIGNMMSLDEHHLTAELETVRSQMRQPGVIHLVIDFAEVPYFGSVMLGAIPTLARQLQASHGKLALCNLSAMAREVLQITRIDTVWPSYASRQEALDSFSQQP